MTSVFTSAGTERVLTLISACLSPYVGATMAGASVRGFSSRLGHSAGMGRLDRSQVEKLLEALAPGLDVYIGSEKTKTVLLTIWTQLDQLPPGSVR